MNATISRITYYPVKGLTGQDLSAVTLIENQGLPEDRRFALAHGASAFDADAPEWQPKSNFLMLARNERLATLEANYEAETTTLSIKRAAKSVVRGDLTSGTGKLLIGQFLEAYLGAETFGRVRIVSAPGHMFSDAAEPLVSLINHASVRDLERVARAPVDPRRFRGNLLLDGLLPWAEFALVGRILTIGDAKLEVVRPIPRCTATNVNPETGERDMNIPRLLRSGYDHLNCGVYARVLIGGRLTTGDNVAIDAETTAT